MDSSALSTILLLGDGLCVCFMRNSGIGRRRVEARFVGDAGALGLGHGVVDFEDHAFGSVLTVRGFAFRRKMGKVSRM